MSSKSWREILEAQFKANETVAKAFNDANETPTKLWNEYSVLNTLYNNKKHIIFSCDKPINQIKDIEERYLANKGMSTTTNTNSPYLDF